MTFDVRMPRWFPLLIGSGALLMGSAVGANAYLTGNRSLWFLAAWGVLVASSAIVFRNFPVLKVRPDRIVSRLQHRVETISLYKDDRLEFEYGELYVVGYNGSRKHVDVSTPLLNSADWDALQAAVAERWPPQPRT